MGDFTFQMAVYDVKNNPQCKEKCNRYMKKADVLKLVNRSTIDRWLRDNPKKKSYRTFSNQPSGTVYTDIPQDAYFLQKAFRHAVLTDVTNAAAARCDRGPRIPKQRPENDLLVVPTGTSHHTPQFEHHVPPLQFEHHVPPPQFEHHVPTSTSHHPPQFEYHVPTDTSHHPPQFEHHVPTGTSHAVQSPVGEDMSEESDGEDAMFKEATDEMFQPPVVDSWLYAFLRYMIDRIPDDRATLLPFHDGQDTFEWFNDDRVTSADVDTTEFKAIEEATRLIIEENGPFRHEATALATYFFVLYVIVNRGTGFSYLTDDYMVSRTGYSKNQLALINARMFDRLIHVCEWNDVKTRLYEQWLFPAGLSSSVSSDPATVNVFLCWIAYRITLDRGHLDPPLHALGFVPFLAQVLTHLHENAPDLYVLFDETGSDSEAVMQNKWENEIEEPLREMRRHLIKLKDSHTPFLEFESWSTVIGYLARIANLFKNRAGFLPFLHDSLQSISESEFKTQYYDVLRQRVLHRKAYYRNNIRNLRSPQDVTLQSDIGVPSIFHLPASFLNDKKFEGRSPAKKPRSTDIAVSGSGFRQDLDRETTSRGLNLFDNRNLSTEPSRETTRGLFGDNRTRAIEPSRETTRGLFGDNRTRAIEPSRQMGSSGLNRPLEPSREMVSSGLNRPLEPSREMVSSGLNRPLEPSREMVSSGLNRPLEPSREMVSSGLNQSAVTQQQSPANVFASFYSEVDKAKRNFLQVDDAGKLPTLPSSSSRTPNVTDPAMLQYSANDPGALTYPTSTTSDINESRALATTQSSQPPVLSGSRPLF